LESLVKLLAPFAPHITEELWKDLGQKDSIHISKWPVHDEKYLLTDKVTIVIQVNGKVRAQLELPADADETTVVEAAKADPKVTVHLVAEPNKTIYIPKKLVNFVV